MEKKNILRGAWVGIVAGLLAFVFSRIFAEPVVQRAIDYESGRDQAEDMLQRAAGEFVPPGGGEIFSRGIQRNAGIATGLILFGLAIGLIFAVAYTFAERRYPQLRPRTLAVLVAGGGFLTVFLTPFVKYPSNPPSIGHSATIGARSGLYLAMVFVSVFTLALVLRLAGGLVARLGIWNATLAGGAAYLVVVFVVMALLPSIGHLHANVVAFGSHPTETPLPLTNAAGQIVFPGFPADDLFQFRLYSVGNQVVLWATLGLVFAAAAERLRPKAERTLAPSEAHAARSPGNA